MVTGAPGIPGSHVIQLVEVELNGDQDYATTQHHAQGPAQTAKHATH